MRAEIGTIICFNILGQLWQQVMNLTINLAVVFAERSLIGLASTHFVRSSMATMMYLNPPAHLSKGPTILIEIEWKANLGLTRLKLVDFARG